MKYKLNLSFINYYVSTDENSVKYLFLDLDFALSVFSTLFKHIEKIVKKTCFKI